MIDHKNKFIFIHIPKCGGNSLKQAIDIRGHDHSKISAKQYFEYMKYIKFTFVRNPWDRFVSAYAYIISGGMGTELDLSFKKIVESHDTFKRFACEAPFVEYLHFVPMFDYINIGGRNQMDFVGKIENFKSDFNTICDKIGIPHQNLPHKNKSKHKHYTEYYDDETKQIVAEKYAKDIALFGYKFGE